MSTTPRPFGRVRLLAAGVACAAVLTACGGGDDGDADTGADAGAKEATASEQAEPDLASGLLTADDFGPDAVVAAVSPEDLEAGAGIAAELDDVQITPESCSGAVEGTQPDLADFDDVAAVSATEGTTVTVEMLTRGGPVEGAIDQLAGAVERCPQAQVSSPEIGEATVTFEEVPVGDLGDGSAALLYTTLVGLPDGTSVSVPALVGAVQDGDRLVILTTLSVDPTGAGVELDLAAFAALLEQAYQAQAAAFD
ncbi:hypothetical protein [Blastococcus sp. CCUG 61487]|uniref:hypothetical protein n=1 Tax=Blastococcus sp. CCUG 61487 TaxID=1840703 RepID=UPI0010C0FA84|nr:hypothetical protein [Blastococcus sp. CCUG 61487]TKJ28871.1 hypothetical protein A6V29_02495 [Blastococcus sp. CCUG 61487]